MTLLKMSADSEMLPLGIGDRLNACGNRHVNDVQTKYGLPTAAGAVSGCSAVSCASEMLANASEDWEIGQMRQRLTVSAETSRSWLNTTMAARQKRIR